MQPQGEQKNPHHGKNERVGSMVVMTVPIPAFVSYRCINATISAKYDIIGAMMLVTLSPTR